MIVMIIVIALFIGIGIIFINGKGSSLIAGFNTMSPEEKENYDTVALCKFMGKMMFVLSFCMLFWLLSEVYASDWLFTVGIVLFIGVVVFMLIYANTGNRFKK
ncbi:DUF3784 domain-containing protein [Rummeliibacillus stabekisii]|uniref:DUF3784 domain-containing protein n=1 Tax=Rummeliibacillus stabekisii TaxID=241244 RepID=UPI00203AC0CD|nr:DUF3784 domain-containing protein [Rummeliibacillus stabekisii]MCM3317153.1 DUF3784 domain-containing protein [Rummeliibacillus stabekisii]